MQQQPCKLSSFLKKIFSLTPCFIRFSQFFLRLYDLMPNLNRNESTKPFNNVNYFFLFLLLRCHHAFNLIYKKSTR